MRYYGEYGEDVIDLFKPFKWIGDKVSYLLFGIVCRVFGHDPIYRVVKEKDERYEIKKCRTCGSILEKTNR